MKRILQETKQALNSGLYLLALHSCVALPDICGALMSEDGVATSNAYKKWYVQYGQKYVSRHLLADDCYLLRCSFLHQAKTVPSPKGKQTAAYSRIVFTLPGPNLFHDNIFNEALNLDLVIFCKGMIAATEKWIEDMEKSKNGNYTKNVADFARLYTTGIQPYIVGIPVIT